MHNSNTKSLTLTGLFAALVFLATFSLHVPVGANGGYVHFGDALVYVAAAVLPLPNAMVAAAIGAGLSDFLSPGAAIWVLPTVIIKALCCVPFTSRSPKLLARRNIVALFVAAIITAVGYGAATAVITGNVSLAILETPFSFIQSGGSAAAFALIATALDKTGLKLKFLTAK